MVFFSCPPVLNQGQRTAWLDYVCRWVARPQVKPLIPPGQRVYAVGDIHGRADLLSSLLSAIETDAKGVPGVKFLVFVGDYIDRGPDSRGVIECLLNLSKQFHPHFIRGNHDQALLDFIHDPKTYPSWKEFGGQETLWSYGVRPPKFDHLNLAFGAREELVMKLPSRHLEFFQNLQSYVEIGEYYFTHAGVRPGVSLRAQSKEDLMRIRDDFLTCSNNFGKIIVHGHSADLHPAHKYNRIGIDTGAYATGKLTAAVLEKSEVRFLQT